MHSLYYGLVIVEASVFIFEHPFYLLSLIGPCLTVIAMIFDASVKRNDFLSPIYCAHDCEACFSEFIDPSNALWGPIKLLNSLELYFGTASFFTEIRFID